MKVNVYAKDLTVTKDEENKISEKLSFLDKYLLIDSETTAQVVVKKHGNDIKLEITIPSKVGYLRSEVVDHALRNAIDESIDKLEDQVRRQKTRLNRRHKEKLAKTFIDENDYENYGNTLINFVEKVSISPFPFAANIVFPGIKSVHTKIRPTSFFTTFFIFCSSSIA